MSCHSRLAPGLRKLESEVLLKPKAVVVAGPVPAFAPAVAGVVAAVVVEVATVVVAAAVADGLLEFGSAVAAGESGIDPVEMARHCLVSLVLRLGVSGE